MTVLRRIVAAFVLQGAPCFRGIHRVWWLATVEVGMAVAALLIKIGLPTQTTRPFSPMADLVAYMLLVGYAGLPLLIPFAHFSIERWRQMRPNNDLDRAAEE
jgi:hypothetical protein